MHKGHLSLIMKVAFYPFSFFTEEYVQLNQILAGIDQEIARLQHARELLAGDQPRRGRPRGSKSIKVVHSAKAAKSAKATAPKKRKLSAEGRKRIAEAMRKRWAERKKSAGS